MGKVVRTVGKIAGIVAGIAAIGTGIGAALGGTMVFTALGGSIAASTIAAVAGATAALAGTLAGTGGGPKIPKSDVQLGRLQARLDTQAPRKMVLGTTAFPADIRYYEGSGEDERVIEYIIAVAAHKVREISELWIEDELAWSETGGIAPQFIDYLGVEGYKEGRADNTRAINGGARWGSDDRLTGCAYLYVRVNRLGATENEQSPFANGLPGRVTIVGEGMPMYDPRFDSTRGGSGSMRVDNQNTWGPSSGNPIIQSLNVLLGWRINGKLSVGAGLPAKYINFDSVITAANACDEDIVLASGGAQPRYRTAGAFSTDDAPMNIVGALLAGCAGDLLDSDGQLSFLIKTNTLAVPAVTFDDHDILSAGRWDPMGGQTNLPNIISGNFTDPSDKSLYQPVPYPSVRLDSEDGIERTASIDFATVENAPQAERLAKQTLQRMQYPGLFSAEYNMKGMAAKVGSIVWQSYSPRGWVNKPFRVVSQKPSRSGRIALVLREEHEDIYAWEAEDTAAVEPAEPVGFDPRNTGPILLAREASKVAEWPRVIDSEGTKPEDNATVGAPNGTPVGDRTAEQVTATLDGHSADWIVQAARNIDVDSEIAAAKDQIDDLFDTYGSTAAAADSAAIAQSARDVAQQARDTTLGYVGAVEEDKIAIEGLTTQAVNAKTDAVAAKEGAEGAYAGASSERALAAGFKDQAGEQAQAAAGSASTAIAKAGEATARAAESVEARNAAGGHASAASASAATAGQKASEASASADLSAGFTNQAKNIALSAGMVPNGSFDNGNDGWGRLDNLEFEASSNPEYGNNLRPTNNSSATTAVGPLIPVDPALVYEIYSKFVVHLNGLSMYAGVECFDAVGDYLGAVFLPSAAGQPFSIGLHAIEGRYTGETYSTGDNVGTSFIAGTRGIRPLLHGNWTGVAGGVHNFLSFGMEEVSTVVAAETQANIATSQAVIATAQASAAEDNKTLSASFASQALQGADAANTQAGIATDQAVVATAQAAAAKQNAVLSASVTGRYLNPNPGFAVYSEPSGNPEGWGDWNSNVAPVRTTNPRGGYALQTSGTVSDGGLVYPMTQAGQGWCVLEAEVELLAGNYVGSGITLAGAYSIDFATSADSKGDVSSSKTGIRSFSRLVNVSISPPFNFHLMHNWSGFGASTDKALEWMFVGIRPASEAEILAGSAIPGLQASVAINQAAIANAENTAAFLQVLVEASGSNPAIVQLLAGRNGSAIDLVSDVLRIRNKLDGQLVDVATFEGGIARLNAALIRALAVAPTPLSQIFHKVMLEPLRFTGSHDQTIQYQGGAAYESPPTITRDTTGEVLPALPAGEAYDIRPVNITNTSFGIRAVKLVAGGAATQTSAAGSNVGGTPQWRTNKPTSANASSGDYTFSGTVTLSKLGETQIFYADEGNPSTWRYTSSYGGQVQLYGLIGSTWTLLATRNLSRSYTTVGSQAGHDATRSFAFNETVNSNADFGSGANRFGVHPGVLPATTITAFAGVTYNTQTTSSEVALGGNFKFVVSPQTE